MAVNLTEFVQNIMPHVSGCPRNLVVNAVRKAIDRLCTDAHIWREDIPAGDITINVDDYTITPPANTRMVTLISLLYEEQEIAKRTEEWLDANDVGWRVSSIGTPTALVYYAPDRIKFNRLPLATITDGLVARVVLKPTRTAETVEDIIYEDWFECIEHGALHYLMEIPKKDWSDIQLSQYHGRHFIFQIQRAKAYVTKGNVRGIVSAPKVFFG